MLSELVVPYCQKLFLNQVVQSCETSCSSRFGVGDALGRGSFRCSILLLAMEQPAAMDQVATFFGRVQLLSLQERRSRSWANAIRRKTISCIE